jgi:hypothetical protein
MERGRLMRSGSIEQVTAAASTTRLVRLSWAGDSMIAIGEKLKSDARISEVRLEKASGTFRFSGAEDDLAPVLAVLVAANIPITSFGEVKQTVEEVYMKLSTHEVM